MCIISLFATKNEDTKKINPHAHTQKEIFEKFSACEYFIEIENEDIFLETLVYSDFATVP